MARPTVAAAVVLLAVAVQVLLPGTAAVLVGLPPVGLAVAPLVGQVAPPVGLPPAAAVAPRRVGAARWWWLSADRTAVDSWRHLSCHYWSCRHVEALPSMPV